MQTTFNRRRSDRHQPKLVRGRVAEKVDRILAKVDPVNGITAEEATQQALPKELFGGSIMAIPLMIAGILLIGGGIVWWCFH